MIFPQNFNYNSQTYFSDWYFELLYEIAHKWMSQDLNDDDLSRYKDAVLPIYGSHIKDKMVSGPPHSIMEITISWKTGEL